MANQIMNIARGKYGYYANASLGLSNANSRITVVVLEGSEGDDILNNYDNLSTLLAAVGNTEATATGYQRKQHAGADITYSIDDTNNTAKVVIGTDDTWTSVSGNAFTKLLVCYDPDVTVGTDADLIVLSHHDFVVTPNGGDITANYDQANGIYASA